MRHFPQQANLTDSWKEVFKISGENKVSFLKGDVKKTKQFIGQVANDVGHCDGKYAEYTTN